jgi:biopolymer transport protein ExbD
MMTSRSPDGPGRDPDLTPMIDVVFLLVIFFLCTVSFRVLEGRLDTQLPRDGGGSPTVARDLIHPIPLHVERDTLGERGLSLHLGARRVSLSSLTDLLTGLVAGDPGTRVRISTGEGVLYGQVMAVLDACVAGGVGEVTFAAVPL